jgi:enterochelin esterase-like enzyme
MRRVFIAVLCLMLARVASAAGTVEYQVFFSSHLGMNRAVGVYLPEGYDPAQATRYPVVYFLHGWGGNHSSYWYVLRPVLDSMIGSGEIQPCIVVTPNGNAQPYDGSMWTNSELYGAFDDYLAYDVTAFIDATYRTLPTPRKRSLMGHSMGAIGTMTAGFLHPDLFGALAGHSGFFNWDRIREDFRDAVLAENEGPPYDFHYGGATYTSAVFLFAGGYSPDLQNPPTYVDYPFDEQGNVVEDVIALYMTHNPDVLAAALPPDLVPDIFFDCGDQDEFFMYPTNSDLASAFDAMGIEYVFQPFVGNHDLTPARLQQSLAFLDQAMNNPTAVGDRAGIVPLRLRVDPSQLSSAGASAAIRFSAPVGGRATLRIIGLDGRLLDTVLDEVVSSGEHSVRWRPRDLPAGVYFCEFASERTRATRTLIVYR